MSPWAPDRASTESAPEAERQPDPSGAPLRESSEFSPPRASSHVPLWLRIVPFFLSSLLFLSAFFAVFSPLPLLLVGLSGKFKRGWLEVACVSNAALVFVLGGESSLAVYGVFVLAPSLTLVELLRRGSNIERAAGAAFLSMVFAAAVTILFYSQVHQIHPVVEIRNAVSHFVDYWVRTVSSDASRVGQLPSQDPAELQAWKEGLILELPSAVAVLGLVLIWTNLTLILRLNPQDIRSRIGVRPDFFQNWKAPEWLVWPTLASGATLLFDLGLASDIGRNVFKFLMAIYAIQGLSILSFFFAFWKLRRFFRLVGYLISVLLMMPLLLSLGFFDLWFDFRAKFRQS